MRSRAISAALVLALSTTTVGVTPQVAVAKDHSKGRGCVAGAIIGGLLGAALAGKNNRGGGALVGAAVGCAAGWGFAANWSARDKAALDAASEQALDAPTPQTTQWTAPESGQAVTFQTAEPEVKTQTTEISYVENVAPPPQNVQIVARPFRANTVLRLRSSPDASNPDNIIGRFERGELVEVTGLTPDGRWAMIGDNGVVIGYAAREYLVTLDAYQTLRRTTTAKVKPDAGDGQPRRANATYAQATPKVVKTSVMASTQCKSVVASSGAQSQRRTGCESPKGDWVFA